MSVASALPNVWSKSVASNTLPSARPVASESVPNLLPHVLAFAAGNFLYIAMADLIPDLHRGGIEGGPLRQLLLIGAGIATIVAL